MTHVRRERDTGPKRMTGRVPEDVQGVRWLRRYRRERTDIPQRRHDDPGFRLRIVRRDGEGGEVSMGLDLKDAADRRATGLSLPTDSAERKDIPMYSGLIKYFPAALAGVARHSKLGNDKHNPGEPLHHARGKSADHEDCIVRHLVDLADLRAMGDRFAANGLPLTSDGYRSAMLTEANALCWRALALSQQLHEDHGSPLAPGAKP